LSTTALLIACAGPTATGGGGSKTPIVTAGTRCAGGSCVCRQVDAVGEPGESPRDEGAPASGQKRFEVRTGRGLDAVDIEVEGRGVLSKSTAVPDPACAYIDLPPGKYKVVVRARVSNPSVGMEPALFIDEYGERHKSWYHTFQFRCGGKQGPCSEDDMREVIAAGQKIARGLYDPCGSTKVRGLRYDGKRVDEPGTARLSELTVELTLDVYPFEPRFPHGAPKCHGVSPE
jgi:hypothetical protein